MKRLLILTSVLALAACGGGSGSTPVSEQKPQDTIVHKFIDEHLDGMNLSESGDREFDSVFSEYAGNIVITQNENGDITNLKIDDSWYSYDTGVFDFNPNDKGGLSAKVYSFVIGSVVFNTNNKDISLDEIKSGLLAKVDENDFMDASTKQALKDKINAVQSKNDIPTQSWTENTYDVQDGIVMIPVEMDVDVMAYGKNVGLRFSNFGQIYGKQYLGTPGVTQEDVGYVFAGGYDTNKVTDKSTMNGTMTFSGKAVGQVMRHQEHEYAVQTNNYMFMDSDAELVFNNGTETLDMNFSDNEDANKRWYDVHVVNNGGGTTITLSNGDKISEQNQQFKFANAPITGTFVQDVNLSEGHIVAPDMTTNYYGENINNPTEVVGGVSLLNQTWDWDNENQTDWDDELFFTATFGATKNE